MQQFEENITVIGHLLQQVEALLSRELSYEERIFWFVSNHCQQGATYEIALENMKNSNLDAVPWHNDTFVRIPRTVREVMEKVEQ